MGVTLNIYEEQPFNHNNIKHYMCVYVWSKNSETVNGSDLKFASVILRAIHRSTAIFKFSDFHRFLNR